MVALLGMARNVRSLATFLVSLVGHHPAGDSELCVAAGSLILERRRKKMGRSGERPACFFLGLRRYLLSCFRRTCDAYNYFANRRFAGCPSAARDLLGSEDFFA